MLELKLNSFYNKAVGRSTIMNIREAKDMAKKLSKEERKAMARKAMEKRAKQPKPAAGSGFAKLDSDAAHLRA